MTRPGQETERALRLVITNFSGGKRHTEDSLVGTDGVPELVRLSERDRTGAGLVLAIQEMSTTDPGIPVRAAKLEGALGRARSSFVARVSTEWYPLAEKWGTALGGTRARNEGLCVVTGQEGLSLVPWAVLDGPDGVDSAARVIDLPSFEFADSAAAGDPDWLHATTSFGGEQTPVAFRPTHYRGSRDSDPRVAQACLLGWAGSGPAAPEPVCVLVNVHLATLRRENAPGVRGRVPSAEASFLRDQQLRTVARAVQRYQDMYDLPVIVAGDFNAEPNAPEMVAFAESVGGSPLLAADVCWNCGSRQTHPAERAFYRVGGAGMALTTTPGPSAPIMAPVCCNELCRVPRFTHKQNLQLIDNVLVLPARSAVSWRVITGTPVVDLEWGYSDHAAIVVPIHILHVDRGQPENEIINVDSLRN